MVIRIVINDQDWKLYIGQEYKNLFKGNYKRDSDFLGCTDKSKKMIWVDDTLSDEKFDEVLAHELCHACHYITGQSDTMTEEQVCYFVGRNILTINRIVEDIKQCRQK